MRTYTIAQGTLLNVPWWPEWERNPNGMKNGISAAYGRINSIFEGRDILGQGNSQN